MSLLFALPISWAGGRCGRGRNPTLRTGRGGRGTSAKQRPGRTDGELVYLYTPIHSRPVARGAIASTQDGFVVGRWLSVEKALHRIVANILAAFGKCPERIVARIGTASCRTSVCQSVSIWVDAGIFNKNR